MEQGPWIGPSWEASGSSSSHKTGHILLNLKVYFHIHMNLPLLPNLNQICIIHKPPYYFLKILNVNLPSVPRSSKWLLFSRFTHENLVCISLLCLLCHMPRPYHVLEFDNPKNICWCAQNNHGAPPYTVFSNLLLLHAP